ncbi:hypothetical protein I317_05978 [Kwoniella heveanensis CBS 569]|nr:hypothetical protein I317_05978 [Kwoniella heveanensis CBS 569]
MDLDTSDLDAQIAALQAAKAAKMAKADAARLAREREEAKILVGNTPTKASIRAAIKEEPKPSRPAQPNFNSGLPKANVAPPKAKAVPQVLPTLPARKASSMGSSLAALRRSGSASQSPQPAASRSAGFTDKNKPSQSSHQAESSKHARNRSPELDLYDKGKGKEVMRDEDNLAIIENLVLGPKEFGLDPEGEEEWLNVEPNSGIRLSKRILPHSHVQDHLSGRYYLTPSQIYSVIRLSRDGATYDIPVDGDWITIAVVAQRGDVKVSGTKDGTVHSDSEDDEEEEVKEHDSKSLAEALKVGKSIDGQGQPGQQLKWKPKNSKKSKGKERRRVPRKYINFTLCSLPPRTRTMGKTEVAGDALLHLLLFEADGIVSQETGDDGEVTRSYRGGSGGAYERWCNITEGSVIAILNPRVWRNIRGGSGGPHPLQFPLGLNPTSADSIIHLGQAKDLGRCSALQKDGNRCKTWVDLRQNSVCEYHVHAAIQRGKAGRAEFTASTASFALSSRPANGAQKGKLGFDQRKKTGLLPGGGPQSAPKGIDNGGGGATYVVGGGVVNTGSLSRGGLIGFGNEFLSEKLGRNRAGKRKRQLEEQEAERALEQLLERDGGLGGGSTGGKYLAILGKEKAKEVAGGSAGKTVMPASQIERKRPFSASAIKRIGFDPTARSGARDGEDAQRRLDAIAALKGEEPGCRLERLSKRLEEEKLAAQKTKEMISAPPADQIDDGEDMIDLD